MFDPKFICGVGYACGFVSSVVGGGLWGYEEHRSEGATNSLTLEKGNLGTR